MMMIMLKFAPRMRVMAWKRVVQQVQIQLCTATSGMTQMRVSKHSISPKLSSRCERSSSVLVPAALHNTGITTNVHSIAKIKAITTYHMEHVTQCKAHLWITGLWQQNDDYAVKLNVSRHSFGESTLYALSQIMQIWHFVFFIHVMTHDALNMTFHFAMGIVSVKTFTI